MPGSKDQPSWLTEPCPTWCTREHREEDHPDDRDHQDVGAVFPAIVSTQRTWRLEPHASATDLVLRRTRTPGQAVTWVHLEAVEGFVPRLVLTIEAARELVSRLLDIV